MRLLIVTDAWEPQINGVVRTLTQLRAGLERRGIEVSIVGPEGPTMPCPTYPEIRLAIHAHSMLLSKLKRWNPDSVHIATEGPLGWAMRSICRCRGWSFTTSFHTRFPEYLKHRFRLPPSWTYRVLRHFHHHARRVLVPTPSVKVELERRGFMNTALWGRGVDTELFHPMTPAALELPRPIQLFVGRLAVEKNVEAFLKLETRGTKLVVGEGPLRHELQSRFPEAVFLGLKTGHELASIYAAADVFVFPSCTDTFGLVMLEALACGTPVAAFPTTGPMDVLTDRTVASLNSDLARAVERSLNLDRKKCRHFALNHSWDRSVEMFLSHIVPSTGRQDANVSDLRSSFHHLLPAQ